MKTCRLYIISPSSFALETFAKELEAALSGGDVAAFQLRMKDADQKNIIAAAKILLPICRVKNIAFIINDYPEIALQVGADGVHVGNEPELPNNFIPALREKAGENFTVGVSCYDSKHLAMTAADNGADYVSFGAFYPTKTKQATGKPKPEILKWWSEYTNVPCVAIGGINAENCGALVKNGADFIAMVSNIWQHPLGPNAAVSEINKSMESAIANLPANC